MKTYLFDTFNRYKRFSEKLDAKTILCNKSWWVFNDSGEKEVYIFNTDGTLIISISGRVTNATWQYIPANKSLIITGNNQSYMVHPAFYDQMIFALQVDGTNEYAFFIDENNLPSTELRSLADLKNHFEEKERQAELAEERKRQAELAAFMQKQMEEDRERQRLEKEAEKKRIRDEKEREKWNVINNLKKNHPFTRFIIRMCKNVNLALVNMFLVPFLLFLLIDRKIELELESWELYWELYGTFIISSMIIIGISATLFCLYLLMPDEDEWGENLYKKYLKENQNN